MIAVAAAAEQLVIAVGPLTWITDATLSEDSELQSSCKDIVKIAFRMKTSMHDSIDLI